PEDKVYIEGKSATFTKLLSDEILREGVTGRISFTHNILFDYSVSRLLLDEDTVFSFIKEDTSRTIFFRPSLAYFNHHLWLRDRSLFWKVAFLFFSDREIPERARILPSIAIFEAARSIDELEPLMLSSASAANTGIAGVLRAVQALGGLQSPR